VAYSWSWTDANLLLTEERGQGGLDSCGSDCIV